MNKPRLAAVFAAALSMVLVSSCGKGSIQRPQADNSTDLTPNGTYANCFMVQEEGEYRFAARLVDGSEVTGISGADWIWSTLGEDSKGLVSDVRYENGYVYFTADDEKGNALIGVFDANGKVLWSWHIWLTEQPEIQQLDNGTKFMDRNLGAMSAKPQEAPLTYGLKYQWGRKDPFYGGAYNEADDEAVFSRAAENTVTNPALDVKWKSELKDETIGTIEYAQANPMTFIYTTENQRDWISVRNDYLWSDEKTGAKTNYDPCPAGYRVAFDGAWEGVGYYNVDDDPENGGRTHTTEAGEVFWYPLAGSRWGDKGAGQLDYVGAYGSGTIWMRTTILTGTNASCFYYHQGTYVANSYAMYRAHGVAVRCTYEP